MKKKRTRVTTVTCPKCEVEIYSRARHDLRSCRCGTFIDGGFDYLRYGGPDGFSAPKIRTRYVRATKLEIFRDWNTGEDRFGLIKGDVRWLFRPS
jgi:hypothetical protein